LREAISVQFDDKIGPDGPLRQIQLDDNDRRAHLWAEDLRWAGLMFDDFAAGRPMIRECSIEVLRIASCMAENADAMCRELARYLAQRLGIAVELVDGVSWQERERLLDAGAIHLCWLCGLPYIEKADRGQPLEPCVAPVMQGTRYGGEPVYFSDVVVSSASRYASFADLRDCTWAYNEPRSHSGYNVVRHYLAARGHTPDYFGRWIEAGAHQAALRMIVSGEVAAAAIDSTVLDAELRRNPALAVQLKVIETLGPSPAPPWVVSKAIPAPLRLRLRECLAAMSGDAAGRRILDGWGVSHWRAVDDAAYDAIRTMTREACLLNTSKTGDGPHYRMRSIS
jgi:phosphonate transport system substrate-binding protein